MDILQEEDNIRKMDKVKDVYPRTDDFFKR